MTDSLDQLLPAYYRVRDADRAGALAAVMAVIEREADILDRNVAELYDDWFIETCQPWLVPYIGDLLGVRPLQPVDGVVTPRAYVANTLGYRRRKGTAPVLEQLAADVTGWPARVVEYFRLLATTQHMAHIRPESVQSPDLRHSGPLELLDGPFDTAAHTVDVRHIDSTHRTAGAGGDHNIANIGLFLWRLQAFPMVSVEARPVAEPSDGTFWLDPTGRDVPLFNTPAAETTITQLASEVNVPGRLRRRALYDETEGLRQAITNDAPFETGGFLDGDAAFEILVQAEPGGPFTTVPAEEIAICRLDDFHHPPPVKTYSPTDHNGAVIPQSQPITAAIDPELGRVSFPEGEVPHAVRANYAYGFSGELGAGPYSRVGRLSWFDPEERAVTWQRGVSADPDVVGADPDRVHATLNDAVVEWNSHVAANPGAFGVIAILDSSSYDLSTTIEVGVGGLIAVVGARWPLLDGGRRDLGGFVPDTVRPHIRGQLAIRGTAPGDASNPGGAIVDGLLIGGDLRVAPGQLGSLHVGHTTVVPDAVVRIGGGAGGRNQRLDVTIDRSICGDVAVLGDVSSLHVKDSLVGSTTTGAGVSSPAADVVLDSVTLFGDLSARTLFADNSILTGAVTVAQTQQGCMRHCFVSIEGPGAPGDPATSRTPRRHRCQPDLALASAPPGTEAQVLATIAPSFTSTEWGHPGFGQLATTAPSEIATGADDDAEMGAFRFLAQPQRLANLKTVLDEYLPVGLEAGPLLVT